MHINPYIILIVLGICASFAAFKYLVSYETYAVLLPCNIKTEYVVLIFGGMPNLNIHYFDSLRALRACFRAWRMRLPVVGYNFQLIVWHMRHMVDVILATLFGVAVLALLGVQLYMGVLKDGCTLREDGNGSEWTEGENLTLRAVTPQCGNSSEEPRNYPNFDRFDIAVLSTFATMTQDTGWETLYQRLLATAGRWHFLFPILIVWLTSYTLIGFTRASIMYSYDRLQDLGGKMEREEWEERERMAEERQATLHNNNEVRREEVVAVEVDNNHPPDGQGDVPFLSAVKKQLATFWDPVQTNVIVQIAFDPFTELFVAFAVLGNTIMLGMDHHGIEENVALSSWLILGNTVFVVIITIEAGLKMIALGVRKYLKIGWNQFDLSLVVHSWVEIGFEGGDYLKLSWLLRLVRVMRLFKVAEFWPKLGRFIRLMRMVRIVTLRLLIPAFSCVLILGVIGVQLFAKDFSKREEGGSSTGIWASIWLVFSTICGEWVESMWNCCTQSSSSSLLICIPFFLTAVVIGNYIALNLFIVTALCSFFPGHLAPFRQEKNAIWKLPSRCRRFWNQATSSIAKFRNPKQRPVSTNLSVEMEGRLGNALEGVEDAESVSQGNNHEPAVPDEESAAVGDVESEPSYEEEDDEDAIIEMSDDDAHVTNFTPDANYAEEVEDTPDPCCPQTFTANIAFDGKSILALSWKKLRLTIYRIVKSKVFEAIVLIFIMACSLTRAADDINLSSRPMLKTLVLFVNQYHIFQCIFLLEISLKWIGFGMVAYFKQDLLSYLDIFVLLASLLNIAMGLRILEPILVLRTFAVLKTLSRRFQGMRVVLATIITSFPDVCSYMSVCLFFWFVWAVLGVGLFKGKYHMCIDTDGNPANVSGRTECLDGNYTWFNPASNFDNLGNAYLSLLQVATFEDWNRIINAAVGSKGIDEQPVKSANYVAYPYFVVFIIFGSFLTWNLFIGVFEDHFKNSQKRERDNYGSMEMFTTSAQLEYYEHMRMIFKKEPIQAIPFPGWKPQRICFKIVSHERFDTLVVLTILLNMVLLALGHHTSSGGIGARWEIWTVDPVFVAIYTAECLLRLMALRRYYFNKAWNIFDLAFLILYTLAWALSDTTGPTILRLVRVAKVARLVGFLKRGRWRLVQRVKLALIKCIPLLCHIVILLCVVVYVFAIFGMCFFKDVKLRDGLTEQTNFQTLSKSMVLLFGMSSSAGWANVFRGITREDDCEVGDDSSGIPTDCANYRLGLAFILTFLFITFLILSKLCITMTFVSFSETAEKAYGTLNQDDVDMFYEVWAQFVPDGSKYIPYDELGDFIDCLEPPLRLHAPNRMKIISMDILICEGDMIYLYHVWQALARDFLARAGHPTDNEYFFERNDWTEGASPGYEAISSALWRQRQEYTARMIQRAWRRQRETRRSVDLDEQINDSSI